MTREKFIKKYIPKGFPLGPQFIDDFYELLSEERRSNLQECNQIIQNTLKRIRANEQATDLQKAI